MFKPLIFEQMQIKLQQLPAKPIKLAITTKKQPNKNKKRKICFKTVKNVEQL